MQIVRIKYKEWKKIFSLVQLLRLKNFRTYEDTVKQSFETLHSFRLFLYNSERFYSSVSGLWCQVPVTDTADRFCYRSACWQIDFFFLVTRMFVNRWNMWQTCLWQPKRNLPANSPCLSKGRWQIATSLCIFYFRKLVWLWCQFSAVY